MRALAVNLILATSLLVLSHSMRCEAQAVLGWTPSPDLTVVGYYLVWGLESSNYTFTNICSASQTSEEVDGLTTNQVYYFNIESYNSAGIISLYAGEIVFTNGVLSTSTSSTNSLAIFVASTNGPPALGDGSTPTTISGNGGSGSMSSNTAANLAANFWGVPPFLTMTISNGNSIMKLSGTVGSTLFIQSTTNVFSADSWHAVATVAMTNIAQVAQSNQNSQPQDSLDLAFVPSAQALTMSPSNLISCQFFRAVMPYDYVILANLVLISKGYAPRLIVVNMPGIICDDACFVTEGSSFIHYDRATYALQLDGSGPTIRQIATTLANSLGLNWTSASEFTYSNGVGQILATVVETEPPSSDPVAGHGSPGPPVVIDF
jgi:hypothetical protein